MIELDVKSLKRELYNLLLKIKRESSRAKLEKVKKLNKEFDKIYDIVFGLKGSYQNKEAEYYDKARNNFLTSLQYILMPNIDRRLIESYSQRAIKYLKKIKKP